jgi:ABC-type lipoprotein release transport system permease subunit
LVSLLYGIAPTDAATLATAALALFCVTVAAAIPSLRVSHIDPLNALRHD